MSYESSSGPNPPEQEESLSATAMFLRSLEGAPAPASESAAAKPEAAWPAAPQPAAEPLHAGPGEFTRLFQAGASQEQPGNQQISQPAPAYSPSVKAGPGEFTRIFHASEVNPEAKTVIEPPPYSPPAPSPAGTPSRKGFSSPGVSDSASGEGSFTQLFKSAPTPPAAPVSPPAAPQAFAPASQPLPAAEPMWRPEANMPAPSQPASGPSVTSLLSTLAGPSSSPGARNPEPVPYRPEQFAPAPAYTPPLVQETQTPEAGSVTRLIQRLSQVPQESAPPLPPSPPPLAPQAGAEPGEFTRMISAASFPPPPAQAAPPLQAQPPAPAQPAQAFAMPHMPPPPAIPTSPAHAMQPKIEMPKPPMPVPAAIAAPKGKLEGMVPMLLIVNTFLLVLLLVVVLFALKGH